MPPDGTRRSGRIPKQVAITLIGSDIEGRVFSERTKTVVLSRNGAGITSAYKLSPEQEIVIRSEETSKEIEGRVVGQIGSDGDTYIYGVAFLDRGVNFWGMEFPDLSETERRASQTLLECGSCHARETADHSDLASDVMAINQSIVRYCQRCGSSTLWKQPDSAGQADAASSSVRDHRQAVNAPRGDVRSPEVGGAEEDVLELGPRAEPPIPPAPWRDGKRPSIAAQPPPTFAGAAWTEAEAADPGNVPVTGREPCSNRDAGDILRSTPTNRSPTAELPASNVLSSRPAPREQENRRKHVRTRVSLNACVRHPGQADEVVACEDMSRGGLRFKSTRKYVEKMMIEVAVPYSPGDQAIFVPAQIAYVQELPEQKQYRCGATYLRATK